MVVKIGDVVSKKKGILFIVLVILTFIALLLQNTINDHHLDLFKNFIAQISSFMIYMGLISVLMSSVTWKWKKMKNEETNQYEFVERKQETPQEEFNRRRLFALGVFTSIYGTAIQVVLAIIHN